MAYSNEVVIYRELSSFQRVKEQRRFETLIKLGVIKPGYRILDIGCGYGELACSMARLGGYVIGVDTSLEALTSAREFAELNSVNNIQFCLGSAADVPSLFIAGAFEVITCSEILEHLPDYVPLLKGIRSLVSSQGTLLISVPNREVILQHVCVHCGKVTPAYGHLHSFDEITISNHLNQAGFCIERSLTIVNRLHNLPKFARMMGLLPYEAWLRADQMMNAMMFKASWLLVKAKPTVTQ